MLKRGEVFDVAPANGSPDSVKVFWPRAGTEVFLERLDRLGPAIGRHA